MQSSSSLRSLHHSSRLACLRSTSCSRKRVCDSVVYARKRDFSGENGRDRVKGKIVDENMIVLRMRIQEIKNREDEEKYHATKWDKWTEWEKEWCKNYESDVFEVVGILQMSLMNIRPSLAIGMVTLLVFSLCGSAGVMGWFLLHSVIGINVI